MVNPRDIAGNTEEEEVKCGRHATWKKQKVRMQERLFGLPVNSVLFSNACLCEKIFIWDDL